MSKSFEVSVVIPVYNAERFVERAIVSALNQEEVKEVVVVDDGYQDGAYEICQQLAKQHNRIKLLTHPNHENKGAATSRNLGILNTTCDYIAFLDADDYFLPDRFRFAKETFIGNHAIEGVYEPVGAEFLSDEARQKFIEVKALSNQIDASQFLSYPEKVLEGKELFFSFIEGYSRPCTDGITIKKSLIAKAGLFNDKLTLHQDSEYWIRCSFYGYLAPTSNCTEPVSIRSMHDSNRIYNRSDLSALQLNQVILSWLTQVNVSKNIVDCVLSRYQRFHKKVYGN